MRRKLTALVLCLLLVFQLAPVPSEAAGSVYFTAVNKNVLPLSDEHHALLVRGVSVCAQHASSPACGRDLGVTYYPNIGKQTILLYVDDTIYSSLVFDVNNGTTPSTTRAICISRSGHPAGRT